MTETSIVHSSYGDIIINKNGNPVEFALGADTDEDLRAITKFDLPEYEKQYGKLDAEYDILDLGYWHHDGNAYEPPASDHRNHILKYGQPDTIDVPREKEGLIRRMTRDQYLVKAKMGMMEGCQIQACFHFAFWKPLDLIGGKCYFGTYYEIEMPDKPENY